MPTSLDRPLNTHLDRYELLEDAEQEELLELYLLLSHAKGLEEELKQALGPDRWQYVDTALTKHVKTVQPLEYQSRKDVFIRSTTVMENTRDFQIDSVMENQRWAIRFMILTTLFMIIDLTMIGAAIFGPAELSASARQLILPNAALVLSSGIFAYTNSSRFSRGSDHVQHDLISKLHSIHREAVNLVSRD